MLYILEGPDGSGKTSLASMICQRTGYQYLHATDYKGTPEGVRQWFRDIIDVQAKHKHLVLDRALVISDMIYDHFVKGKEMSLTDEELIEMKDFLRDLHRIGNIRYIACCGVSTELVRSRPEDNEHVENMIRQSYPGLCKMYLQLHHELAFADMFPVWWYMPDTVVSVESSVRAWCSRRDIGRNKK